MYQPKLWRNHGPNDLHAVYSNIAPFVPLVLRSETRFKSMSRHQENMYVTLRLCTNKRSKCFHRLQVSFVLMWCLGCLRWETAKGSSAAAMLPFASNTY